MTRKFLLIRDSSPLASEAENYLIENNIDYDVFFSDEKLSFPLIYSPFTRSPFVGADGFKLFKNTHAYCSIEKPVVC